VRMDIVISERRSLVARLAIMIQDVAALKSVAVFG
jgi:hypothetical protein